MAQECNCSTEKFLLFWVPVHEKHEHITVAKLCSQQKSSEVYVVIRCFQKLSNYKSLRTTEINIREYLFECHRELHSRELLVNFTSLYFVSICLAFWEWISPCSSNWLWLSMEPNRISNCPASVLRAGVNRHTHRTFCFWDRVLLHM